MVDVVHAVPVRLAAAATDSVDEVLDFHRTQPLAGSLRAHPPSSSRARTIFTIPGASTESLTYVSESDKSRRPLRVTTTSDTADRENVAANTSDNDLNHEQYSRKEKSDVRRYHALLELLDTERDYLNDLRILVDIYLSSLPSLSVPPSRSRSLPSVIVGKPLPGVVGPTRSLPASSRSSQPHSTLLGDSLAPTGSSRTLPPGAPVPALDRSPFEGSRSISTMTRNSTPTTPLYGSAKNILPPPPSFNLKLPRTPSQHHIQIYPPASLDSHTHAKPNTLPLLASQQTQILARNTSALLDLHVKFLTALDDALLKAGFLSRGDGTKVRGRGIDEFVAHQDGQTAREGSRGRLEKMDDAIKAACHAFSECAPTFEIYAPFCAGHTDALDLVRKLREVHPAAWDMWEKGCARKVWDLEMEAEERRELERGSRRHSIDGSQVQAEAGGDGEVVVHDDEEADQIVESPIDITPSTLPSPDYIYGAVPPPFLTSKLISDPPQLIQNEDVAMHSDEEATSDVTHHQRRHSVCASSNASVMDESEAEVESGQHRRSKSSPQCSSAPHPVRRSQTLDTPLVSNFPPVAQSDPGHTYILIRNNSSPEPQPTSIMMRMRSKSFGQALNLRGQGQKKREVEMKKRVHTERSKLMFADYLIKPVQRICKYPLLLEQLRSDAAGGVSVRDGYVSDEHTNMILSSALAAVKSLLLKVDEARMKAEMDRKSRIVAERLIASSSYFISSQFVRTVMSTRFVEEELGNCLFAGGLDVVEWLERGFGADSANPTSLGVGLGGNLKARYLGVFLYAGGFLIIAKPHWLKRKAGKSLRLAAKAQQDKGRGILISGEAGLNGQTPVIELKEDKSARLVYEPRHWFALEKEGFEVGEGEALLSHSFRLYSSRTGYRFELAASCAREKDVWVTALRESMDASHRCSWWEDPPSSLQSRPLSSSQGVFSQEVVDEAGSIIASIPAMPITEVPITVAVAMKMPTYSSNSTLKPDSSTIRPSKSQIASSRGSSYSSSAPSEISTLSISASRPADSPPTSVSTSASPSPQLTSRTPLPSLPTSPASADSSVASPVDDAPFTSIVFIRRPTTSRRAQVDRTLHDVFSEPCLTARVHAHAQEEVLFPDPIARSPGFNRHRLASSDTEFGALPTSTSQLLTRAKTMAYRMNNRLSIRVKPTLSTLFTDTEMSVEVEGSLARRSSDAAKATRGKFNTIEDEVVGNIVSLKNSLHPSSETPEAGELASRSSSVSTSNELSDTVTSPLSVQSPPTVRVVGIDSSIIGFDSAQADQDEDNVIPIVLPEDRPKRTRSLVDNVRGFFLMPRWSSSVSSLATSSVSPHDLAEYVVQQGKNTDAENGAVQNGLGYRHHRVLTKFWKTASLRRRVRSEPDVPRTSQSVREGLQLVSERKEDGHVLSPTISADPISPSRTSPAVTLTRSSSSSSVMLLGRTERSRDEVKPRASAADYDDESAQTSYFDRAAIETGKMSLRRSLKHRVFFQNLNPLTPVSSE